MANKDLSMKREVYKLVLIFFTLALIVLIFYPLFSGSKNVKIVEVIDGDTVKLEWKEQNKNLRLKSVDTPETSGYNTPEEYEGIPKSRWECLQKWGYKAKELVETKIHGREVKLRYRRSIFSMEKGRYGRMLGEIELEGQNKTLGKYMVEKGYARSYDDSYSDLEARTRNNSKGLWECKAN